ncbi:MAG TPA: glycoside hydrolase family 16 protein [Polyangia bacterium]|nr:glycoside hydrolase family 16 protein [Polyangia bacterium]
MKTLRWPSARLLPLAFLPPLALALGACTPPPETGRIEDPYGSVVWHPGNWTVVWSDEFDGAADAPPDPTKWSYETGGWGWGNKELQNYTDSPTNGALDGNGHLVITARAEMSGTNAYTSARLTTKGHFSRTYGRFEARMRLATGAGLWPAFWIMGDDIDTVGWPSCGEMDIVEESGSNPAAVAGSVHGPVGKGPPALDAPASRWLEVPGGSDADFHVYAVEWDADNIVFLLDEVPYMQITPARRPLWVWDHPFFMIVNLAVGGLFPGPPNATTVFPATITVDYVRVSARAGDGGAGDDAPSDDAEPSDGGGPDAGAGD